MPEEPYALTALQNRLTITGQLVALTALRIGAGRANEVLDNDLPVLRDVLGRPFIPGASLKGALRARIEALIRAIAPGQVLDFEEMEQRTKQFRELKERNPDIGDAAFSAAIWQAATMIDLTFGSPELAGRLFFKDGLVDERLWFMQFELRNGVVLNRDTETAEEGLLYDYEVVPAGTRFQFELVLETAAPWQRGLVLLALRPWMRGEAQIGGFRSRGLGYVQLDPATVQSRYIEIRDVDDVVRLLYDGLTEQDAITLEDERQWIASFTEELRAAAASAGGRPHA